jgi:hypothetical protein
MLRTVPKMPCSLVQDDRSGIGRKTRPQRERREDSSKEEGHENQEHHPVLSPDETKLKLV